MPHRGHADPIENSRQGGCANTASALSGLSEDSQPIPSGIGELESSTARVVVGARDDDVSGLGDGRDGGVEVGREQEHQWPLGSGRRQDAQTADLPRVVHGANPCVLGPVS